MFKFGWVTWLEHAVVVDRQTNASDQRLHSYGHFTEAFQITSYGDLLLPYRPIPIDTERLALKADQES